MSKTNPPNELPSFHPTETESISSIPERFLLDGLLQLGAEGQWKFRGEPIEHQKTQRFLSLQLQRSEEGDYWVVNGPQRVLVEVEDAPFLIVMLAITATSLQATLNDGTTEEIEPSTFVVGSNERIYAQVKFGKSGAVEGTGHRARLTREAAQQLAPILIEMDGPTGIGIAHDNRTFPLHQETTPSPTLTS